MTSALLFLALGNESIASFLHLRHRFLRIRPLLQFCLKRSVRKSKEDDEENVEEVLEMIRSQRVIFGDGREKDAAAKGGSEGGDLL